MKYISILMCCGCWTMMVANHAHAQFLPGTRTPIAAQMQQISGGDATMTPPTYGQPKPTKRQKRMKRQNPVQIENELQ